MRIRMSVGKLPMSGYVNIDPVAVVEEDKMSAFDVRPIDFRNLDVVSFDAECEEIFIDEAIDYVHFTEVDRFLQFCIKKLRHNGKLTLTGLDAYETARRFYFDEISEQEVNTTIFGDASSAWSFKNSMYSVVSLRDKLHNLGLEILEVGYNDHRYTISARRK